MAAELLGRPFFDKETKDSKVKGAILLSGIYEPEVVLGLDVNEDIRLNDKIASDCNVFQDQSWKDFPI